MANKSFYLSSRSLKDTKQLENVKLNSLIIAIALSINFIASVLNNVFNLSNLISILSILFFIYLFIRNRFRIKKRQIMFIAITGLPVLLSLIIGDLSNRTQVHYMLAYMMNVIIIVYFVSFGYDFKKICKYICFIFTTLIWTLLFFDISNYDYGALMGWSYSVIPFFLSSIYYLFYCDEDNKLHKLVILFSNIIYILWIYKFMSRGPILALATYIYLLYILNCKKDIKYAIMLIFFFTLFILLFLNFQDIVVYINNVLLNYNINIRFLNKTIFLLEEGKFDNGRLYIYKISWNSFKNHPILGNGIAALDRLYGINYDHSIILQLLNECGIIFLLIHIIIIFKGIFIIYKYWNQDLNTSRFLLFLACNSIIRLLFSYVLWLEQGYWMFLYVAFAYKLKKT